MHNDLAESFLADFAEDTSSRTSTLNWPTVDFNQFGERAPRMVHRTGSRFIDEANPNNNDWDFLCGVSDLEEFSEFSELAMELGWDCVEVDDVAALDFMSFKKDEINLIVTDKPEFFRKFRFATDVAKELQLSTREKRVCLFQAILYGKYRKLNECRGNYLGH